MNKPQVRFKSRKDDYKVERLKDFNNIFAGGTPSTQVKEYWQNGEIPWMASGYIHDCIINKDTVKETITEKGLAESSAKMIKPNTTVMAITGATCANVGYITFPTCANQSVMAFENDNKHDAKYLFYLLQKNKKSVLQFQAGGAQAGLNKEACENLTFIFPSLSEQEDVSLLITKLDEIIDSQKHELELTKNYKKSMLSKMFPKEGETVPEIRFKGFDGDWEQDYLSNKVEYFNGLTYSPSDIVLRNGTLVLRSSNVQEGELSFNDNVYVSNEAAISENVKIGDIIVVVRNGSRQLIGKHAIVKKEMKDTVIGAFMTGIRSKIPDFYNALLSTNLFNKQVNDNMGATINQITGGTFSKMTFVFPSEDEQEKIGYFFKQVDETILNKENEIKCLEHLKATLLNKMFA